MMPGQAQASDDMNLPSSTLQEGIIQQREALHTMLRGPLQMAAEMCSYAWHDRAALDEALQEAFRIIPACKYLYALNTDGVQVSSNVSHAGLMPESFGRDRSERPYLLEGVPADGFVLSHAYISLRNKRPSLTAIQLVRGTDWHVLGFIGADFDLRALPITRPLYEEPTHWRQIKGDPAIRGTVFHQTRTESVMDSHVDTVMSVIEDLMAERGVHHVMLHFSSSRAVIWLTEDPLRYRMLDIDALIDPNICLTYPPRPYPVDAVVAKEQIRPVLDNMSALRVMPRRMFRGSGVKSASSLTRKKLAPVPSVMKPSSSMRPLSPLL